MNRRASRILTVCAGAWLLVIWGQSCMPAAHSGAESGALLTLVQAFLPHMTDHILRKCAHFGEYALLGVFTAAALRTGTHFSWPAALLPRPQRPDRGRLARYGGLSHRRAADAADLPPVPETARSLRKQKPHEPVQCAQTHGVILCLMPSRGRQACRSRRPRRACRRHAGRRRGWCGQ